MRKSEIDTINLDGGRRYPASYVLLGAAAGFLNGALGALGGIALAFALGAARSGDEEDGEKNALATSLCVMLPVSAVSLLAGGSFTEAASGALPLFPTALLGGVTGALLSDRLKGGTVRLVFAAVTGIAGLSMLFGG